MPSHDDLPWNPQARTTTETVLREAMQALWRVQAHMLARIVVEIRAADIAVELEPYHMVVMSSMLATPTSFPVAQCLYGNMALVHVYQYGTKMVPMVHM